MNDEVTSNIIISYKGYDATVIAGRTEDHYWYASHNSNKCHVSALGKDYYDLKQEYAKSIDDYLNWLAEEVK